ncbi:MAG TPA: hypothetical protein VKV21_02930 [Solirubrobacteraceae bacterium]|nr:hypothetical protein [Solirubrobacteraceae bacterium]
MKVFLMYPNRDFDPQAPLPANADDLVQDLELRVVIQAAAHGDQLVWEVFSHGLLDSMADPEEVRFRQEILADCRENSDLIRDLYVLAGQALEEQRHLFRPLGRDEPTSLVSHGVRVLELMAGYLERLRSIADEHASGFASAGFRRFFSQIAQELDDGYLAELRAQLEELKFPQGQLVSAHLGPGNRSIQYVARRPPERGWFARLTQQRAGYSFTIPPRDDAGAQALEELRNRGANQIGNVVKQACDHVLAFFDALHAELAFYVGALNLYDLLTPADALLSTPVVDDRGQDFVADSLYDVALALTLKRCPVPNDLDAPDTPLIMITGANQGGKSTTLRAIGQAQLMAQAGLDVGARALRLNLCSGVFTHYKREEDAGMESGKLDEELSRMSAIADRIKAGALLLCNESFASTNEREGSEIARQIIRAMLDSGVKVVFVTHQYDLASSFWKSTEIHTVFLRAEREEDGQRSYKLTVGEPLPTSYGADSYAVVFGRSLNADALDSTQTS